MEADESMVTEICPTKTQTWIANGAILVDVREKVEIDNIAFDVPNIIHLPLSEFESRYTELPKDKELVIVCRAGIRSLKAAAYLLENGYDEDKVVNMKHGIIRWIQKEYPTIGSVSYALNSKSVSGCSDHQHKADDSCCCSD